MAARRRVGGRAGMVVQLRCSMRAWLRGCVCGCMQCVHARAHTPSHLPFIAHSSVPHTHLPLTHWDLRELSHEDHEHVPPVSLLQEFSMVGTAVGCSVGAGVVAPGVAASVGAWAWARGRVGGLEGGHGCAIALLNSRMVAWLRGCVIV